MDIISLLQDADKSLYQLINRQLSADWLDGMMKLLRTPYTWIPLYLFLLIWFYRNARKYWLMIIIFSVITFAFTDFFSSKVLKPSFQRARPCYVAELNTRSVVGCGGAYGLPSSHASNHFGLAAFWFIIIAVIRRKKIYWFWLWAFVICYAQVNVGVHYPGDIVIGALFGISIALVTSAIFHFLSHSDLLKKRNSFSLHKAY